MLLLSGSTPEEGFTGNTRVRVGGKVSLKRLDVEREGKWELPIKDMSLTLPFFRTKIERMPLSLTGKQGISRVCTSSQDSSKESQGRKKEKKKKKKKEKEEKKISKE